MTAAPHADTPATPALTIHDGQIRAKSTDIAAFFHQQHKNILVKIDLIVAQNRPEEAGNLGDGPKSQPVATPTDLDQQVAEFAARNFQKADYTDAHGETRRAYELTRDGFTLLAMGFTGANAMRFKIAYIQAFNAMEAEMRRLTAPATPLALPPTEPLCETDRRRIAQRIFGVTRSCVAKLQRDINTVVYYLLCAEFGVKRYWEIPPDRIEQAMAFLDGLHPDRILKEVNPNA